MTVPQRGVHRETLERLLVRSNRRHAASQSLGETNGSKKDIRRT
ncbi:hypothetical protein [Natronorubrum sp. FCH18a]